MGKLKPIGSEKLSGTDKIKRMIEISRYKESIPKPINEDKSTEYSITLSDGKKYQIVKEKVGYVIKKNITESNSVEYLEPMKNRKYYSSYSQAFKRLNLIAKELNKITESNRNISLFTESDMDPSDEKYFLVVQDETNEQQTTLTTPTPTTPTTPTAPSGETPVPSTDEIPAAEPPIDEPKMEELPTEDEISSEEKDEEVTIKTLQKLTGKLAQKIREFSSNEENQLNSKDIKYIVNSVLSALDLEKLDEEDKEEIMGKFEGSEDMDVELGGEDTTNSDEVSSEEMPSEEPIAPPAPEGEMGEEYDMDSPSMFRRKRHHIPHLKKQHSDSVGEFFEGVFNESKIDKVIGKYFVLSESEQKQLEKKNKTISKIKKLSENIAQEVVSRKFFEKNPTSELIGKTEKKNLVFKLNEQKIRITPNGKTI